ncbi:hypothetical protein [Paracoccus beibuensis]|uniref:hypothetical protein n=1 Tax=Paracoccus beibuensis TaxID=547602 RepID=UPI00223F89E1|nr:hypothetical protein [Paracoccus beibuensis]
MKITHDDTTFTMTSLHWTGIYPIGELPKWLAFYRRQRRDFPKAGTAYDAAIEGLEKLADQLKVDVEPAQPVSLRSSPRGSDNQ